MDHGTEEDKEMPQEMSSLALECERNDSDGIDDAAGKGKDKKREILPEHTGDKEKAAPSQNNKEHRMKNTGTSGAENSHKDNSQQDKDPLDDTEDGSRLTAPEKQPHRCKGATDEQINGNIVEPPPEALDPGAPAERMVKTAHQKHHQEAEAIDRRTEEACTGVCFQQEQHQPGNGKQRTDAMGDCVADFLEKGTLRRLVERARILFHTISSPING